MGRTRPEKTKPSRVRRARRWCLLALGCLLIAPYLFLPGMDLPGTGVAGPLRPVDPGECRLLIDVTALDSVAHERVIRQEIFDGVLSLIREAESFVYADFFLWNGWQGAEPEDHRGLSTELAQALIVAKTANPQLTILALTDPINRVYGEGEEEFYGALRQAGIVVVFTDLDRLPASNLAYTPFERAYLSPLSRAPLLRGWFDRPIVANPFESGGTKVSLGQVTKLLNFRANHRKMIIADHADGGIRMIATSFNPADGSSAHSNVGLMLESPVAVDALAAELECVAWSAEKEGAVLERRPGDFAEAFAALQSAVAEAKPAEAPPPDAPAAQWLTESAIRGRLLEMLGGSEAGDRVDIGIFYLSDRGVARAIADAAGRGADVRIIADANRDAFGRVKNGIPNRPMASELMKRAGETGRLRIRWADTHGEQFHPKVLSVTNPDTGKSRLLLGSANWTRRNLRDLNLEADVYVRNVPEVSRAFVEFFDRAWENADGLRYTRDYEDVAEHGWTLWWKTRVYRFQEASGLSTF